MAHPGQTAARKRVQIGSSLKRKRLKSRSCGTPSESPRTLSSASSCERSCRWVGGWIGRWLDDHKHVHLTTTVATATNPAASSSRHRAHVHRRHPTLTQIHELDTKPSLRGLQLLLLLLLPPQLCWVGPLACLFSCPRACSPTTPRSSLGSVTNAASKRRNAVANAA